MLRKLLIFATVVCLITASFFAVKTLSARGAAPHVATLTLVSAGNGGTRGHAFLMVTNTSKSGLVIAGYSLEPGKTMTVGTFGNKSDGKGVYFNLEAYRKMSTGNSIANPSLSAGDVKTLSKYVTEHSYWTCPENCSVWASRAWNLFADTKKQLSPGYPATPTKLKGSIGKLSGYEENIKLPKVKKSDVMYLGTDGKPTAADAKTINVSSTGSGLLDSLPFAVCF